MNIDQYVEATSDESQKLNRGLYTARKGYGLHDNLAKIEEDGDLAAALDQVEACLDYLTDGARARIWWEFENSDSSAPAELSFKGQNAIERANLSVFRLMNLREALLKKAYGRADFSRKERRELDVARGNINA